MMAKSPEIYKAASSGLELDDEPSSRATRLQPSVGITGSLRWVGVGHAEGDGSRLHELPEAVKFLELAVVRAHRGRCELDATLWRACETTYRRERATVADGRNHPFVEDGTVGETVDAVSGSVPRSAWRHRRRGARRYQPRAMRRGRDRPRTHRR